MTGQIQIQLWLRCSFLLALSPNETNGNQLNGTITATAFEVSPWREIFNRFSEYVGYFES